MLVKLHLGVAAALVLLVAVVATRPSTYHVERKLEVAARADLVFGVLNDLHQFAGVLVLFGSPFDERDPDMQTSRRASDSPTRGTATGKSARAG